MTDDKKEPASPDEPGANDDGEALRDSKDNDVMRALLKRSMDVDADAAITRVTPDLLRGVQKKIRQRSKGKFYADGWSTSQSRVNYALVAIVMLLIIAMAYFALGPTGISAH